MQIAWPTCGARRRRLISMNQQQTSSNTNCTVYYRSFECRQQTNKLNETERANKMPKLYIEWHYGDDDIDNDDDD